MKKYIAMAVAAGALAVGGAASAQDLGTVITSVLGFGQPTYTYPNYNPPIAGQAGVYTDPFGRRVLVDPFGRPLAGQNYGVTGYDAWGRPIYGNFALNNPRDRDNDGVRNRRDRYPDDPRFR